MRRILFGQLAVVLLAGLLTVFALPAAAPANTAQGYIAGFDQISDDWNDEGPVDTAHYAHSNAAAVWQMVLWADGYLTWDQIDCRFGPITKEATVGWQNQWNPSHVTGTADTATWQAAGLYLSNVGTFVTYTGEVRNAHFTRLTTGQYEISLGGAWRVAYYTSASVCG